MSDIRLKTLLVGCFGGFMMFSSYTESPSVKDYSAYVNPFIDTGEHGHTFLRAVVPHGMIQPSPNTRIDSRDAYSGYYYDDNTIDGFSHTHVNSTGCCDCESVLLIPIVGKPQYLTAGPESQKLAYASAFSYENETAEPGYYSISLDTYQVKAEITATKRGAIHRCISPESTEFGFIIDLDYNSQRQTNYEMEIEAISDTGIRGHRKVTHWAFDQCIDFYAKFSRPFVYTFITDSVTMDNGKRLPVCGAVLYLNTKKDEEVLIKAGISAVDITGARKNVEPETPEWDSDKVRKGVRIIWNNYPFRIDTTTPDEEDKAIFYTVLYHTAISPSLLTDVDGRYFGMNLKVHQGDIINPLYTVFSLWDTFRVLHPLMTIINPNLNNQFINSPIKEHQEGRIYPTWDLASNYTGTMIRYHAVPVIVDAYMKGYRSFDAYEAYKASLRAAEYDTTGIKCPDLALPHPIPKAKYYKNAIGYIPYDRKNESVAKALGHAYDDQYISIFAEAVNDFENKAKYKYFAKAYKPYLDKSTRFMCGLGSNGERHTPFDPRASTRHSDDYYEGTAWQWTQSVPHDVEGLVKLMEDEEASVEKLDLLFIVDSSLDGKTTSANISGLIGQYAHGSEPGHYAIHLYNCVDCPWRAQELVDSVYRSQCANNVDRLPNSEDYGQVLARYIFNSVGFYQVCPGKPVYSIGRPALDKAMINLPNEKTLSIVVKNDSKGNKYTGSVLLNSELPGIPFFEHRDIVAGGTVEIKTTDRPT